MGYEYSLNKGKNVLKK